MKHYQVLLNGENFNILVNDVESNMGFYTTRFVSALNQEQAELEAVKTVKEDEFLKAAILNKSLENTPMIYMEEMFEIKESDIKTNEGFSWYEMGS